MTKLDTAAKQFAATHTRELAGEILEWQDTAILRDGKLRELAKLCDFAAHDALKVAEHYAERAIMRSHFEAQGLEVVAQQWDGCNYEGVGESIDIGAAIRSQRRLDGFPQLTAQESKASHANL